VPARGCPAAPAAWVGCRGLGWRQPRPRSPPGSSGSRGQVTPIRQPGKQPRRSPRPSPALPSDAAGSKGAGDWQVAAGRVRLAAVPHAWQRQEPQLARVSTLTAFHRRPGEVPAGLGTAVVATGPGLLVAPNLTWLEVGEGGFIPICGPDFSDFPWKPAGLLSLFSPSPRVFPCAAPAASASPHAALSRRAPGNSRGGCGTAGNGCGRIFW